MAIEKIVHLADIHLPKSILRHDEYKQAINSLIISIREQNPDRIVIVGDLFNDYVKIEGELLILASRFVNALAKIAPVIITRGNHDIIKTAANSRIDSVEALTETMKNPRVKYYNTTGLFDDENVVWAVWKHGEKHNNPWLKVTTKHSEFTYIDLFHDPVNGCSNSDGYSFNSKTYRSINDFKGDFSFFGDIHLYQVFDDVRAYSGSLVPQNYSEGDDVRHGYILWNIKTKTHEFIDIPKQYNFHTVNVNRFTDFDNLTITIPDVAMFPRIRVKWQTLPATRTVENERKILKYLQDNFAPISIKHKNEFVENAKIDVDNTTITDNITKRDTLHVIFREYLEKLGVQEDVINEIFKVDVEIENRLEIEPITNIQWSILKFKGKNFRNLKEIDVDWRNHDGVFQITGKNTAGKSSIIQFLSYVLYGKTLETDSRKKFGDARFVNNLNGATSCDGEIVISCNGEYYGIKRITVLKRGKDGELNGAPTSVSYYILSSPDDAFDSTTSIEKLDDDSKHRTQKRIEEIIGTYENFIRIILTTADTLNKSLDTDNSVFIDSIMADAGLNIFDLRLTEFKKYLKELKQDRISCNVEIEESSIQLMESKNHESLKNIDSYKNALIISEESNKKDLELKTSTLKTLNKIDRDIESLNIDAVNKQIDSYSKEIIKITAEETATINNISKLAETYDENELERLIKSKEDHRNTEFKLRTEINTIQFKINNLETEQIRINGDIVLIKREGKGLKDKVTSLKESKNCPTCGQAVEEDAQKHIQEEIAAISKKAHELADQIKEKEEKGIQLSVAIETQKEKIRVIEKTIADNDVQYEPNLIKIGDLTNKKIEVQKRKEFEETLKSYPIKIENINLKIASLVDKIDKYKLMESQIEENQSIMLEINAIDERIDEFQKEKTSLVQKMADLRADIEYNNKLILRKKENIVKFKEQEKMDMVHEIYEKCIHRDGVPTQILSGILLPQINNSLSNLLQPVDFSVWLDPLDLRLKMSYATHPNSIVDCISGSGKERTFSSISLKVALNEINNKSKPTIFMLDEVMGKLKDESVDEFINFISIIKTKISKLIIIEQNHELNPDYTINAVRDINNVTTIKFEP